MITLPLDVVKTYQQIELGEKDLCKGMNPIPGNGFPSPMEYFIEFSSLKMHLFPQFVSDQLQILHNHLRWEGLKIMNQNF